MAKKSSAKRVHRKSDTGEFVSVREMMAAHRDLKPANVTVKLTGAKLGRNATTGRIVLAPAIKAGKGFRSDKEKIVREVLEKRRMK